MRGEGIVRGHHETGDDGTSDALGALSNAVALDSGVGALVRSLSAVS